MSKEDQPINNVKWVKRNKLKANTYNPNHVYDTELELLKTSIKEDGWTQPIVALKDGTIVDGFHRWTVSGHKEMLPLTNGYVPVVYIDADDMHKMMSTIRHNRARGQHIITKMSDILKEMVDSGLSSKEIQTKLGMTDEEIARLTDLSGMPVFVEEGTYEIEGKSDFSKAWEPTKGK